MAHRLHALPLFVILMGIAAALMLPVAAMAYVERDMVPARAFFYSGILLMVFAAMVAVATANRRIRRPARGYLITMALAFSVLPAILAVPMNEAVPDTRYLNAWFEMVSAFTTTGATLYDDPARLPRAVHLWRATVGWLGGFFIWVTAIAVLAPMNLGGFEVRGQEGIGAGAVPAQITRIADTPERLGRFATTLLPVYAGLTLALWISLIVLGDGPFVALCHAMSTLATSGISPVGGLDAAPSGMAGEGVVFLFLVFALSRRTFATEQSGLSFRAILRDPEFRIGMTIVGLVPLFLFLRHFIGAIEVNQGENVPEAALSAWGGLFMVMSFLTTAGWESGGWDEAQRWSGLGAPGLILLGLALVGGGVATTAGGVKLLRVYALLRHLQRELERLVHPHSLGGAGSEERRMRQRGAYAAWVFFMLFAISIAVTHAAIALTGPDTEDALVLALAALTTTGPLAQVASDAPISYAALGDATKGILCAAMVLGRLETLAIIALLNPDFWRN